VGNRRLVNVFLTRLCLGKNSLKRAPRALAPTKRGVSRAAARDKRELLNCESHSQLIKSQRHGKGKAPILSLYKPRIDTEAPSGGNKPRVRSMRKELSKG